MASYSGWVPISNYGVSSGFNMLICFVTDGCEGMDILIKLIHHSSVKLKRENYFSEAMSHELTLEGGTLAGGAFQVAGIASAKAQGHNGTQGIPPDESSVWLEECGSSPKLDAIFAQRLFKE